MIEDITHWRAQGVELRQRLVDERAHIIARVAEIDAALARLPGPSGATASVPARVSDVLAAAPAPLTAIEVRAQLPGMGALAIGNALHRLCRQGIVLAEGPKGKQRYRNAT